MAAPIYITGVKDGRGPNNQTPVRMELSTFLSDPDRQNLFLLGLQRLQARPENDPKSWYQICGIHGRPKSPWGGDVGKRKDGSYCTHSSVLFLTWHRPYICLMEQVLCEDIQAIVETFPSPKRERLAQVAKTIRFPYWDWAARPNPDAILTKPTITVETPTGRTDIDNPLYSYKFKSTSAFEGTFANWTQTVRHPGRDGRSQDESFRRLLIGRDGQMLKSRVWNGPMLNLRERVWHLLNIVQDRTFQAFSNDDWIENGLSSDYDSLESVHDYIHGRAGNGGHMNYPDYAAFDPVFWLHHINVDRLYALWQALHPDRDLNWEFSGPHRTWFVKTATEEEDTPLVPFSRDAKTLWDSNSVRDLKVFNYTYPELVNWNVPGTTRQKLSGDVAIAVRRLYGNNTPSGALLNTGTGAVPGGSPFISLAAIMEGLPPVEKKPAPDAPGILQAAASVATQAASSAVQSLQAELPPLPVDKLVKNNKHREYFANIRAPKYAFNGPYAVHVFMGEFSADPEARQNDRDLVGSVAVFANDIATTGCKSCHQNAEQGMVVTGAVPLTTALIERIDEVGSLDPADVEPYLTKNLHWRIHRYDVAAHPNVDRREAPGVLVAVTSVVVEHPTTPDALPVYKDWNPIPGITAGRPAGADATTAEGYEAPGSEL